MSDHVDLLAIAAHRDDVELTCGGTLAKAVTAGHRVGIIDLTQGEMGTRGDAATRAAEAERAAKTLGVTVRLNAGMRDAPPSGSARLLFSRGSQSRAALRAAAKQGAPYGIRAFCPISARSFLNRARTFSSHRLAIQPRTLTSVSRWSTNL